MRRNKDNKKKQLILGIFIAIVMIGSTFGVIFYGYNNEQGRATYKGFTFSRATDGWLTKISDKDVLFSYLPEEVEDIKLSEDVAGRIRDKLELDVTYDINSTYSEEIALSQYLMENELTDFSVYIRKGLTDINKFNVPVITCNESSSYVPVIYFEQSNETYVNLENDCIVVEVKNSIDVIRAKDRLVYGILRVI